MLRHQDIWRAIDRLAEQLDISVSALARRSDLDPTTFNKSKRTAPGGRRRWPTTESISKLLAATETPMAMFVQMMRDPSEIGLGRRIPLIGQAEAGRSGYFDDAGLPAGNGWDEFDFPNLGDPHAYALEINGDSMEPVFREDDIIVVSPFAETRRGDRAVVKTRDEEVMAKELVRKTALRVELKSHNPDYDDVVLAQGDIIFIHRIVWVSQ
jgi:phage repressor protein C with HTH and peptisase S24 domain|tara:strand:- start:9 stop:641 length:633 start_codon:yes stop_codon:yes gene_type:complete